MQKIATLARHEGYQLLFFSVLLLVLTGCGPAVTNGKRQPYAYETYLPSTSSSGGTTTNRGPANAAITPTPGSSPAPTYTETPNHANTVPVLEYQVAGIGYKPIDVTVRTGRVLRVKFKALQNSKYVAGTNTKPQYTRLAVYVSINGQSQPTEILSNGLGGGNADESRVIDLSYALKPTCPASTPGCRETVVFKIEKPNNDFYCVNTGQGCPWTHVPDKHPWSGVLYIQTDDTESL